MNESERIAKLEGQVASLQAALSLVLSPEHRVVMHGAGVPPDWKEDVIQSIKLRWNMYNTQDYDVGPAIQWANSARNLPS